MDEQRTTVAISGGGPAGIMLGLLLARRGVEVVVLEKHADFLRDFRGDTVHPMTLDILDELGLMPEFDRLVRGRMRAVDFSTTDGTLVHQDLDAVAPKGAKYAEIALAPQWDLLDLLSRKAREHPSFRLEMEAETTGVLRDRLGRVRGLRYRQGGEDHRLRAVVSVAADGRRSGLREAIGTGVRELGSPIDVLWFRLPRREDEPTELRGTIGRGGGLVAINRGDYWQIAFLVRKGTDEEIRAAGLPAFRERIASVASWTADRLDDLASWDDVKLLSVTVERLRQWAVPGLVAIGDAAHTMSPMGGVGVNLAISDAVAAANLLAPDLLRAQADPGRFDKVLNPAILDRIQQRRQAPTMLTQRLQVIGQDRVIAFTETPPGRSLLPPKPILALLRGPVARLLPRVFVYGIRPERVAG